MTVDTTMNAPGAAGAPPAGADADATAPTRDKQAPEAATGGFSVNGEQLTSDQAVGLLMLERAQTFTTLANDKVHDAQDKLKNFKEITKMVEKMRNSQRRAGGHGHATRMDADVVAFCRKWNISLDTTAHDDYHTHSQWDVNIQSANGLRDKWSDELRVVMLKLKATMNELNNSVSGASKMDDKSAHVSRKILSD